MSGTKLKAGQKHTLTKVLLQFREFTEFRPPVKSKPPAGGVTPLEPATLDVHGTKHGLLLTHIREVTSRWIYLFVRRATPKGTTVQALELVAGQDGKYREVDLQRHLGKDLRPTGQKQKDHVELWIDPAVDRVFACLSPIALTSARLKLYLADPKALEQRCAEFRFDPAPTAFPPPAWRNVIDGRGEGVKAVVLADPIGIAYSIAGHYHLVIDEYLETFEASELNAKRMLGQLTASVAKESRSRDLLANGGRDLDDYNRKEAWRLEHLPSDAEWWANQLAVWLGSGPFLQLAEDHVADGDEAHDAFLTALSTIQLDLTKTRAGLEFFGRVSDEPGYFQRLFEGSPEKMSSQWRRMKNIDAVFKATAQVMQSYWTGVMRRDAKGLLKRLLPQLQTLELDAELLALESAGGKFVQRILSRDEALQATFDANKVAIFDLERMKKEVKAAEKWVKHSILVLEGINLMLLGVALFDPKTKKADFFFALELAKAITKTIAATEHLLAGSKQKLAKKVAVIGAVLSLVGYGAKLGKAAAGGDTGQIVAASLAVSGSYVAFLSAVGVAIPTPVTLVAALLIVIGDIMLELLTESDMEKWLRTCEWGKERGHHSITQQFEALLPLIGKPVLKLQLQNLSGSPTTDPNAVQMLGLVLEPGLYVHGETTYTVTLRLQKLLGTDAPEHAVTPTHTVPEGPNEQWHVERFDGQVSALSTRIPMAAVLFDRRGERYLPRELKISAKVSVRFLRDPNMQRKPIELSFESETLPGRRRRNSRSRGAGRWPRSAAAWAARFVIVRAPAAGVRTPYGAWSAVPVRSERPRKHSNERPTTKARVCCGTIVQCVFGAAQVGQLDVSSSTSPPHVSQT
jgi:hypothetical protein